MKFIRVLLIIILVVVALLAVLGLLGPKNYDVSSTATIDAPKEMVFPYLKSLKKGNDWGPWREQDPDMEVSYEGEDGTVGSISKWDGPATGKGKQEIVAIQENQSVDTRLTFYSPFGEMESYGYFQVEDNENGGSDVTWGFKGDNNFVARIFGVFMNVEKNTKPMFEQGLENLGAMVKADMEKEYNGYKIQLQEMQQRTFMAKRAVVSFEDMQPFFATHLPRIGRAAARAGATMAGMPCGLYYTFDVEAGETDMAAAMPVEQAFEGRDMEAIVLGPTQAMVIDYYGSYDNLTAPHEAMDAYMTNFSLTYAPPVIEEYVTDPGTEPDTAKWLTRITYMIDK